MLNPPLTIVNHIVNHMINHDGTKFTIRWSTSAWDSVTCCAEVDSPNLFATTRRDWESKISTNAVSLKKSTPKIGARISLNW